MSSMETGTADYLARARQYAMTVTTTGGDPPFLVVAADWPGLIAGGETPEAALTLAAEVLADMIERNEQNGRAIPAAPSRPTGRLNLRVSRSLHSVLTARAEAEGVSVSYLAAELLARGLGVEEVLPRPRRRRPRRPPEPATST
ncbi:MAG: type II toxin-antitoxin system HicB family antitoxin [Armatimonadetes bacterium]|nr:type II toxin-antitoxin system HicB family antitoxin [Armatimonadota bacterium]